MPTARSRRCSRTPRPPSRTTRVFDLTETTPLLTTKNERRVRQEVGRQRRDRPALREGRQERRISSATSSRSSTAAASPATRRSGDKPAGNLVLDDDKIVNLPNADDVPGTYYRLAMDYAGRFGHKPLVGSWRHANASRYIRMFQSRRSLLIWKVFGRRTDGWTQRRLPDRDGRPAIRRRCSSRAKPVAEHAGQPQPRRPGLHRQHHAAAGGRRRHLRGPTARDQGRRSPTRTA